MSKTFNIYCDESCHLENDKKEFMLFGCVSSAINQVKRHTKRIVDLKLKHHYYGEIKWTSVSSAQLPFYRELLNYFFDTDLTFRAVVVNKSKINNEEKYVIVLEPLRKKDEYYLLTAFNVRGKDAERDKYLKKYKRRLPNIL